ncbi:MAG: GNAT family N-acetyltransferase [Nodosilinea sp.]
MVPNYHDAYADYQIRSWRPDDRQVVGDLIHAVLAEYGLGYEPQGSDRDALEVETYYWQTGGEFWVVEAATQVVGTAAYCPIQRGVQAVEIRKMYLRPQARRQGLGRYLLQSLERVIQQRGFQQIWIETATALPAAIHLYESSHYQPATGVETARCDRIYVKNLGAGMPPKAGCPSENPPAGWRGI